MAGHLHQPERKGDGYELGNPAMMETYKAGFPGNGKSVPDGAKMAKIHWTPKKNQFFPG
jgi:hypothetical protein